MTGNCSTPYHSQEPRIRYGDKFEVLAHFALEDIKPLTLRSVEPKIVPLLESDTPGEPCNPVRHESSSGDVGAPELFVQKASAGGK